MNNRPTFGIGLRKYLSRRQIITSILVFIGGFILAFAIIGIFLPQIDDPKRPFVSVILSLSHTILSILVNRITKKPAGKFYTAILSPEAVRGEFSLGQDWGNLLIIIILFLFVGIVLPTTPLYIRLSLVVIGIPVLVVLQFLARSGRFNQIVALRVDDEGNISFRRRDQDWQPLILTNYHKIACENVSDMIKISFFVSDNKKPSLSIPISHVRSTQFNSIVASEIMSAFFKEKCVEHRYDFNNRPIAWVATRHKQR